ncbi:MAG: nucleotidyltransferase [Bacteroidota bacterium]
MNIFNDFHQRFLFELLKHKVDFIVVGGLSVVFHGYIRTTGDMDLWIRATNDNKQKLLPVIAQFGISEDSMDFIRNKNFAETLAFHFNNPPEKVEFLTHISGLSFDDSYANCDHLEVEHYDVPFLSFEDLIINKMVAGRLKDQADVEELKKIHFNK